MDTELSQDKSILKTKLFILELISHDVSSILFSSLIIFWLKLVSIISKDFISIISDISPKMWLSNQ